MLWVGIAIGAVAMLVAQFSAICIFAYYLKKGHGIDSRRTNPYNSRAGLPIKACDVDIIAAEEEVCRHCGSTDEKCRGKELTEAEAKAIADKFPPIRG